MIASGFSAIPLAGKWSAWHRNDADNVFSPYPVSGLYLHIPFCKQACAYCNFHFSTQLNHKTALLDAMQQELKLRHAYLDAQPLESLYFGGGTPSLLSSQEIENLLSTISSLYPVSHDAEITLEANPDDLSTEKIAELRDTPVNRLSIGIQSFFDDDLRYLRRVHTAQEGLTALEGSMNAGFRSVTMDLIYGTPLLSEQRWLESLQRVADLGIPHLSAYQLTIEPRTILAHHIDKGISSAPDETSTIRQFEILMDWADKHAYAHYEISNLAKSGHRAIHNSNYWNGVPYLGIGPSAHSFNGTMREWNISNNMLYIKGIAEGSAREGMEILTPQELYNEYIMTGLRTSEGIRSEKLLRFPQKFQDYFQTSVIPYLEQGQVRFSNGSWTVTRSGRCFADRIASALFVVE